MCLNLANFILAVSEVDLICSTLLVFVKREMFVKQIVLIYFSCLSFVRPSSDTKYVEIGRRLFHLSDPKINSVFRLHVRI